MGYASELNVNCSCYWPSEALHSCIVMVTSRIDSQQASEGGAGIIYMWRKWCCSDSLQHDSRGRTILVLVPGLDYSLTWWSFMHRSWSPFEIAYNTFIFIFPVRKEKQRVELYTGPKNPLVQKTRRCVSENRSDTRHAPPSAWPKSVRKETFLHFLKQSCLCSF